MIQTETTSLATIFFLLTSSFAYAEGEKTKSSERILNANTTEKKVIVKGTVSGLSGILSGEYGLIKATPSDSNTFGVKTGRTLEVKLLAGWLFDNFMIDTGLGIYYYKVRGTEKLIVNEIPLDGDREISVSGGLFEVAPSLRVNENLFAGLVTQLRSPAYNNYSSDASSKPTLFTVGGQVGLQIFNREVNSRLTFKTLLNLGLNGWKDVAFLGGVQFGLPFRQPDSIVIRKTTTVNKLRREVEYRKKDFTITITTDVVKLALDNILTFYTDPAGNPILTTEAQSFLVDFGNSLQSNQALWESIRIDAQSKKHLTSIRNVLISIGVPGKKVKGGSETSQIQDGGNASVDFTFMGVKNTNNLAEKVRQAMKAARVPENCSSNGTCQ